jgi:hypothetical protein
VLNTPDTCFFETVGSTTGSTGTIGAGATTAVFPYDFDVTEEVILADNPNFGKGPPVG